MESYSKAIRMLPEELEAALDRVPAARRHRIQEIRLRIGRPLSLFDGAENLFPDTGGNLSSRPSGETVIIGRRLLEDCLIRLCDYSVHSHQHEIAQGFVTTPDGDRAGICACVAPGPDGNPAIREITSINFRISREIKGSAAELLQAADPMKGLIVAGAPGAGKTTLLRDIARSLSSGERGRCVKVALIDERYELSAFGNTDACKDVGLCTDVICGVPKAEAISQAVRTLSPELIICDEVAAEAEAEQISRGLHCGAAFAVSAHCPSTAEAVVSPVVRMLMDTGAFDSIALLKGAAAPSEISRIVHRRDYYA